MSRAPDGVSKLTESTYKVSNHRQNIMEKVNYYVFF